MRLQLLSLVPRAGPYLSCGPGNEAGLYLSQVWERDWAISLSWVWERLSLGRISLLDLGMRLGHIFKKKKRSEDSDTLPDL